MGEQDMASVQELKRLSSVLPEKLNGLTQSFDGVQSAIAALTERMDSRREQVSEILDQLQTALGELPETIGAQQTQLAADVTALETSLSELEAWGEESRSLLMAGANQIEGAISTLVDQSEGSQGTLEELDQVVTTGIDALHNQIQASQSAFASAVGVAYEQAGSFQEALQLAQEAIHDQMDDFSDVIDEGQTEVTSQITSLLQTHFAAAGEGMGQNLTNLSGNVIKDRVQQLLDETQRRIDQELKQRVEETVSDLGDGVTGAVDRLMGRQDKMAGDRITVQSLFDEIDFLLGPLRESAMGVMSILDGLGIPAEAQMAAMANPVVLTVAIQAHYAQKAVEAVGDAAEDVVEEIGSWF